MAQTKVTDNPWNPLDISQRKIGPNHLCLHLHLHLYLSFISFHFISILNRKETKPKTKLKLKQWPCLWSIDFDQKRKQRRRKVSKSLTHLPHLPPPFFSSKKHIKRPSPPYLSLSLHTSHFSKAESFCSSSSIKLTLLKNQRILSTYQALLIGMFFFFFWAIYEQNSWLMFVLYLLGILVFFFQLKSDFFSNLACNS